MGLVEVQPVLLRLYADEAPCVPRIATAFGGGMAGCGEACGALVGALMALGLKFGRDRVEDLEAKAAASERAARLLRAFEAEFGSVRCIDLTECDMRTPEGKARAKELNLHGCVCPKFVAFAARLAEST